MKRTQIFFLLLGAGLLLGACNGAPREDQSGETEETAVLEEQRWEEMMAIHDEVMPKMSQLNRLGRQLREHAEQTENLDAAVSERIEGTVRQLELAEEGMWTWMNELQQLDRLREEKEHAAVMDYLDAEKEEISQVRADMLAAIEQGQALADELGLGQQD
jgi:hypothetical protein